MVRTACPRLARRCPAFGRGSLVEKQAFLSNRLLQVTNDSWSRQWFGIESEARDHGFASQMLDLTWTKGPKKSKTNHPAPVDKIWLKHGDKEDEGFSTGTEELRGPRAMTRFIPSRCDISLQLASRAWPRVSLHPVSAQCSSGRIEWNPLIVAT